VENDGVLVERALHGNLQAFGQLVGKYHHPLTASACQIIGQSEDAEYLAQETLLTAYQRLSKLREREKFRPWLFSILRHKCLDYLRTRHCEPLSLDDFPEIPTTPMSFTDGDILELLGRLSFDDRLVLTARYLYDLDYEDIAPILGTNIPTARMRCMRARDRLRTLMTQADEDETRQLLQHAMGAVALGITSDSFVHRVLREVQANTVPSPAAAVPTPALAAPSTPTWLAASWWRVVAGALLIGGGLAAIGLARSHPGNEANINTCMSKVRQLTIATSTYCQDHEQRYPGIAWVKDIAHTLGDKPEAFQCPETPAAASKGKVSYGYNGLLVRADGSGVAEAQIINPAEVGVICDADRLRPFPNGGLIGGGALQNPANIAVQPLARHRQGIVIGYADGHVQYTQASPDNRDAANPITRAFSAASTLGMIDNPAGGLGNFSVPAGASSARIMLGGDYCTYPILCAAAEGWKQQAHADYLTNGFTGQHAPRTAPGDDRDYLWGCADDERPTGNAIPIARDALVIIIAKGSKIPFVEPKGVAKDIVVLDYAQLRAFFSQGRFDGRFQAYTYDNYSGTARYFCRQFGENGQPLQTASNCIRCANDPEMVAKIAHDPYGIGYCSSAFLDTTRVAVVNLQLPNGRIVQFSRDGVLHRAQTATSWPLVRTLYAECGGKAALPNGIAATMLAPRASGTSALQASPLFATGFVRP